MSEEILLGLSQRTWLAESPLSTIVGIFVEHLHSGRYATSTIHTYLGVLAHFGYWAKFRPYTLKEINKQLIDEFILSHLPSCDCPGRCRRHHRDATSALNVLLFVGRQQGHIQPDTTEYTEVDEEIERFRHYLLHVRAVASSTCRSMLKHTRVLLADKLDDTGGLRQLTIHDIETFVMGFAQHWNPASLKEIRASVKNYLKFRALQGESTEALIAALPVIAGGNRPKLPKTLTEVQLQLFMQAFDQLQLTGQRDYAIARCLVDLGLRGQEVAQLQLDSIDWRAGTLTVSGGKRRRIHKLPLPWQTGEAIAQYLRQGRPRTNNRALFVRHVAPYDKPISISTIRTAMTRAFVRCGLSEFWSTHVLRHTAAVRLQRAGASLKEIADVLGHGSIESTKYYTRVDTHSLSAIALPWPEKRS
jgi:site-specific recombinase XerD